LAPSRTAIAARTSGSQQDTDTERAALGHDLARRIPGTVQRWFARNGRAHEFDSLEERLTAEPRPAPSKAQDDSGASMRKHFRELFRQTIAETVDANDGVAAEMPYVMPVLSPT